ncbi:MAG: hypothetical protein IPP94_15835 [Ignavibacteria bacterium]|nr:hypothetical protein [Ignavibacteria bacterium]
MENDLQHAAENIVLRNIQSALKDIREKWTRAAGVLRELRVRNAELESRNADLEEQLRNLETQRSAKGADRNAGMRMPIDVASELLYFSPDEREALERQIAELLERVDSHLR